jgi:hypothetical protein
MKHLNQIDKQPFSRRFIIPVGIMLLVWIVLDILYSNAGIVGHAPTYHTLAFILGILLFISIGFSPLILYPVMYLKGSGAGERILGAFMVPLAFSIKEIIRVSEYFTIPESIYYGLSSVCLLAMLGSFGLMGIGEIISRSITRKRGLSTKAVVSPVSIIVIVFSIAALYFILIWGAGVHWFYVYVEGYKYLFH